MEIPEEIVHFPLRSKFLLETETETQEFAADIITGRKAGIEIR